MEPGLLEVDEPDAVGRQQVVVRADVTGREDGEPIRLDRRGDLRQLGVQPGGR